MESEGYRGLYPVQATLSPARAAYLVEAGSLSGFRRAVQEASTRWGGGAELIFPIARDEDPEEWIKRVLELTPIDGLVNVDLAESDAKRSAELLGLPWVPLAAIDRWGPAHLNTHPLSIPAGAGDASGSLTTAGPKSRVWEVVAAGQLPAEHIELAHRAGVNLLAPGTSDGIGRAQLRNATWLERTLAGFSETFASPAPPNVPTVIWITSGDSLEDAWDFWNVRALRPRGYSSMPMYLLPAEDITHWLEFQGQLASTLGRPDEISPDVLLTSSSTSQETLREIAEFLELVPAADDRTRTTLSFPPPAERREPPFTYRIAGGVFQFVGFQRSYGVPAHIDAHVFTGQPTVLQFPSPIAFENGGLVKLRLRSSLFDGLPKRHAIASSVISAAEWVDDELEVGVPAMINYRFELKIPSLREALAQLLGEIAASHAPSDKGSIAALFLEREEGVASLLEPNVFEAIRGLTTPRSTRFLTELERITSANALSAELAEFALEWATQNKRTYRLPGNIGLSASDAAEALERLCSLGWAERGFEIKCSACHTQSFIQLATIAHGAGCPSCGAPGRYTGANTGPHVFYRLDGLIDRASDQGIFPHLLTIGALQSRESMSLFLPGVDFTFHDGERREADVVGLYGGGLAVGEVKTSGIEFTEAQMERDIDLARRLRADVYVMAAPDVIADESVATAKARSDEAGLDLVVLDRSSLRP